MLTLSVKDAKYGFGRLIDLARAKPVVVLAVEEYERLKVFEIGHVDSRLSSSKKANNGSSHPPQDRLLHPQHGYRRESRLAFAFHAGRSDPFSVSQ